MVGLAIIFPGILLLTLLLFYEKNSTPKIALAVKTALSSLFIITAVIQPPGAPGYSQWLLGGLLICLIGDVCLALRGEWAFKAGLVAFLLGHISYVLGFRSLVPIHEWISREAFPIWGISLAVFLWLRPHLGRMTLPVVAYVIVITVMATGALAVFVKAESPFSGKTAILLGAVSFYFSDIFVARDKFVRKEFVNRLIGLPLYYLGQFLLAFSIGQIR
jgi:uncharacterized membrane protein YhhN